MGDFVGINPPNLQQLANRLGDLAGVLAKDGALIKQAMTGFNSHLDYSSFARDSAQNGDDSSAFHKRVDLANEVARQPAFRPLIPQPYQIPGWGTVFPPNIAGPLGPNEVRGDYTVMAFDISQASGGEGANDAHDLANALRDPTSALSKQIFAQVGQSVADHADDPAYLQAFYANGGLASSEQLAAVLRSNDGSKMYGNDLLSPDSQHLIALYGQGLASASALQDKGQLPPGTVDENSFSHLSTPKDKWSAAMLLKYGPSGDQWGPQFLANAGSAMLDWRSSVPMRPTWQNPSVNSGGVVPAYYSDDPNAWYLDLGLQGNQYPHNDKSTAQIAAIQANDPSLAVLQRIAENPQASRDLLSGDGGDRYAKDLVSPQWQTSTPFGQQWQDESLFPGKIITNATLNDRTDSPQSQQSAQAAANVMNAAAAQYQSDKGAPPTMDNPFPGIPAGISNALRDTYIGYIPDLAQSASNGATDPTQIVQMGANGPYKVVLGTNTMRNFMSEIMLNQGNADIITGATNGEIQAWTQKGLSTKGVADYLQTLAQLRGALSVAGQAVNYDAAAHQDSVNQSTIEWLNAYGGFIASVPGVGTVGDLVKAGIWFALPVASAQFSTSNAAAANDQAQGAIDTDRSLMKRDLLIGLAASGKIQPPAGHPDWGQPGAKIDAAGVDAWWAQASSTEITLPDGSTESLSKYFNDNLQNPFDAGAGAFQSHTGS